MVQPKPWEVDDELWALIEPVLPKVQRRFRNPGRPRGSDRLALQGVLFVLYTGIQWNYLPLELGFGSGPTCWRRLQEWNEAEVWDKVQDILLEQLRVAGELDFSRAAIDSSTIAAKRGRDSPKVGPSPVDRARPGSKHHIVTDAGGIPIESTLTSANTHDSTQLIPLMSELPTIGGLPGPAPRFRSLYGDTAYDANANRTWLRRHGITPYLRRRGRGHGSGLGTKRWVVEACIAWFHGFRKLRIRWERYDHMHEAFLGLAHCIILARKLRQAI
ncbi:IS5 family transposase [Saccharopolyspora dendranthemae]|uniref:Transposase n=1 Tax=Saccharopolyspora dendranthemae TaxID=1181886 RepID=A0A561TZG3_9PSEU|nr:IS5 family transposase [Saccharopolyspora dendranthemae]TWF92504.1 transposase [Saccharopolyspora dendranthemae]TWG08845.1 IS4 family transposase [Saccharopolyspora dendranthemae]